VNSEACRRIAKGLLVRMQDTSDLDKRARLLAFAAAYHERALERELAEPTAEELIAKAERLRREAERLVAA
jgi:hypothetical protein